jgi:hypothetical protein
MLRCSRNLREVIELYLEDKYAKMPTDRSAVIFTTLSVETHVQTETSLSNKIIKLLTTLVFK